MEVLLSTQASTAGVINTSTNPVDWSKLKNVPSGFEDGVDNTGGGGGTTIVVQENGSTVVETSTLTFNGSQFTIADLTGKGSVVIDTNTAGGIMALSTGTNAAGQLLRLDSSADVPDANLSANVSLLGSQIDISAETNLAVTAPVVLTDDTLSLDTSSVTLLGASVTLGTETDGVYVASLTATSPITLSGTNNAESAAPIIGLTQNAGTDVTADLEEETHATEHQNGGADEVSVAGLSGLLADRQLIAIATNSTTVAISSGINIIPGTNITISGVNGGDGFVDITINSSGGSGDAVLAATQTFSGGNVFTSSHTIPQGASPAVSAVGQIGYDTTDNVLIVHDGTAARVVGFPINSFTFIASTSSDAPTWSSDSVPMWTAPIDYAVTITSITACTFSSAASTVTFNIEERAASTPNTAGTDVLTVANSTANWTCSTYNSSHFSNASIAAGAHLHFDTDASASAGTTPYAIKITVYYRREQE